VAAGPAFFVSAWLLMIFGSIVASDTGILPFGYVTAMIVTIGLWLVLALAIGAIARTNMTSKKSKSCLPGHRGAPGLSAGTPAGWTVTVQPADACQWWSFAARIISSGQVA